MSQSTRIEIEIAGAQSFFVLKLIDDGEEKGFELSSPIGGKTTFAGMDYLDAYRKLSQTVELNGGRVLCQGSARNYTTSPMLRSASKGLKGYLTKFGKPTTKDDVVNLLESADFKTIVSVHEQEEYLAKWLISLKR